jgi:branched-chain amino acid transport system permease protein
VATIPPQVLDHLKGAKRWLVVGVVVSFAVSMLSFAFNRYYLGVAIDVGINVILAVSLNLINGYTGQFSLGHAGFMAGGGGEGRVVRALAALPMPVRL